MIDTAVDECYEGYVARKENREEPIKVTTSQIDSGIQYLETIVDHTQPDGHYSH